MKGKKVEDAKNELTFLVKRAAKPLADLLDSAVANANHNFNIPVENLFVKEFTVNEGIVLKRRMPRSRGMAYPINKRTSHVVVTLDTLDNMPMKKGAKKAMVKEVKAAVAPKAKKAKTTK